MNSTTRHWGYANRRSDRAPSQELIKFLAHTKQETATVVTMLEPAMQTRLDAAAIGSFATVHTSSVSEALRAAHNYSARAVLLSPTMLARHQLPDVGRLVVRCPGVMMVAVVSEHASVASERLLDLGACGVQRVLDVTARDGWSSVCALVAEPGGDTAALILGTVITVLAEATAETKRFFAALIRSAATVSTAAAFARTLGIQPSTLTSRFFRVRLPSPKQYLSETRLLYVSAFLETAGASIADVAHRLEYSSPQSLGRIVRTVMGMPASEFRREYSFAAMLDQYLSRLIVPYRKTFLRFDPLGPMVLTNQMECDARCTSEDRST